MLYESIYIPENKPPRNLLLKLIIKDEAEAGAGTKRMEAIALFHYPTRKFVENYLNKTGA